MEVLPAAKEFIDPVDVQRAADYYDVISNPMCLTTMMIKVCSGSYKSVNEVRQLNSPRAYANLLVQPLPAF